MKPIAARPLPQQLLAVLGATACILLIPLLAMQFTDEVAWSPFDFAVAGVLLGGFGLAWVLGARLLRHAQARLAFGLALGALLVLVWAELAVGVFGSRFAGS
jgi:hypothetical protein